MRVVYRLLALVAAAVVVAVVVLVIVIPRGPGEGVSRPVAAPSAVPPSPEPVRSPTPSTVPTIAPGYTPMQALGADVRVPKLPSGLKSKTVAGRAVKLKGFINDARSGLRVPRLAAPWKRYGPAPFATRQVLPRAKGARHRAMFVTSLMPIETQKSPRDTAQLAARWTLNHHPEGSRIRWVSSQRTAKGWTLLYRVVYGKRSSLAAVSVVRTGRERPALVFVTIPDTQKKRWADIQRMVSQVRVLG